MNKALIGITTATHREQPTFYVARTYVEAIRRAGGVPCLLPPCFQDCTQILDRLDGLLLIGGGDINPCHYNSNGHSTVVYVDPARDLSEIALAKHAMQNQMPILAICRGMQLINVILGGTLHEHLPDAIGQSVEHCKPHFDPLFHDITILPQSQLAEMVQSLMCTVVSRHHQGINKLAQGLEAVAFSPDGLIEAIEMKNYPWLVGVQWHPEMSADTDVTQQNIFHAFITAAGQHSKVLIPQSVEDLKEQRAN